MSKVVRKNITSVEALQMVAASRLARHERRQVVVSYLGCGCKWMCLESGRLYLAADPACPSCSPIQWRRRESEEEVVKRKIMEATDRNLAKKSVSSVVEVKMRMSDGDELASLMMKGGWNKGYSRLIDAVKHQYPSWNRTEKWLANCNFKLRQESNHAY
jgi:hypothetical protein